MGSLTRIGEGDIKEDRYIKEALELWQKQQLRYKVRW